MRRLERGMLIKTSYETGPYRIKTIERGCTCAFDKFEDDTPLPPHLHLVVTRPDNDKKLYWLNYYDEETLESVRANQWTGERDRLIIIEEENPPPRQPEQLKLF